jgi:hypothetical protein
MAPKKYCKINGTMKPNPEYALWKAKQSGCGSNMSATMPNALPVVCSMEDKMEMDASCGTVNLSETANLTVGTIMQDEELCREICAAPDEMVDGLGAVFARYEAPIGLMNKLVGLADDFDALEFIVDDSGSMNALTDALTSDGRQMTRWSEARARIKMLFEMLAWVSTPVIVVRFLNRKQRLNLRRKPAEKPQAFYARMCAELDVAFNAEECKYLTPILPTLTASLAEFRGKRVSRYLFCDGRPCNKTPGDVDEENEQIRLICDLVKHRANAKDNPFTLCSCTDQDDEAEWMKTLEEVAPFCSELDDYEDEKREVLLDQGQVFPFTRGFWLVAHLVGAMNPEDLDAMDESVPFTKTSLDGLLGIVYGEADYRRYWDGFLAAQRARPNKDAVDGAKKSMEWQSLYQSFLTQTSWETIPAVKMFRQRLEAAAR